MFSNISNQKLVLIILIALCPFVYYLWNNEYLVLEIGVEKEKILLKIKNCSTEIEHAIEEHKRKNKEKKEAKRKKTCPWTWLKYQLMMLIMKIIYWEI